MEMPIVIMVTLAVGVLFVVAGRALARTNVRHWEVPADERAWREDQLTGMYMVVGVLVLAVLALRLVSLM